MKMTPALFRKFSAVFLLGISSGLPLLLIGSTLKAWMRLENVDLTLIGVFGIVGLPYTLKFLWAPLLDRYELPWLDRRRGWILVFQMALVVLLIFMAYSHPSSPQNLALIAFLVAFASASQDIAIDAYRRDLLSDLELGLGSSLGVNGYRVGMLVAGAAALWIAATRGWTESYLWMAGIMAVLMLATYLAPPMTDPQIGTPRSLKEAVIQPFLDFFKRRGSLEILVFILLYKIGDQLASDMFSPFYIDMKFSLEQIALVAKTFGFWATVIGGLLGGVFILRWGLTRCLWVFGVLQAVSTLGFSWLAHQVPNAGYLAAVISVENLTSGMATAAYVGYMASLCNKRFSATQYALLSSFMGVPRVFLGGFSGVLAKHLGWGPYFAFCVFLAIPGLLMLRRVGNWDNQVALE